MIIGIPKEIMHAERRVAGTPETVASLVKMGFRVLVETRAGEGIFRDDADYASAGAEIVTDVEKLFEQADLILKVKQPGYNETVGKHEIQMMRRGSTLVTFIHPAAPGSHENVKMLRDGGITAFTMDSIPRISRAQKMDALTSMSTITGYKSVIIAANHMPRFIPMIGTAIGAIKPSKFLMIGAGVVGLQAVATAKRLGGVCTVVDIRADAREQAKSLGATVGGFDVPAEIALGEGGYAKALPKEWLEKERETIAPLLPDVDVVILSGLIPGEVAPVVLTESMVAKMKRGSVIVDVGIDQGGNCSLTDPGKQITRYGVTIFGLQNIPGSIPVDSTWMYANNMLAYVENLYKKGIGQVDWDDEIVKSSLVTRDGLILHEGTRRAMGITN